MDIVYVMHDIADELGSTGLYFMSGCHKSKACSQSWGGILQWESTS